MTQAKRRVEGNVVEAGNASALPARSGANRFTLMGSTTFLGGKKSINPCSELVAEWEFLFFLDFPAPIPRAAPQEGFKPRAAAARIGSDNPEDKTMLFVYIPGICKYKN